MCLPVVVILPQLKADWITILPLVDTLQIKMFTFSNRSLNFGILRSKKNIAADILAKLFPQLCSCNANGIITDIVTF